MIWRHSAVRPLRRIDDLFHLRGDDSDDELVITEALPDAPKDQFLLRGPGPDPPLAGVRHPAPGMRTDQFGQVAAELDLRPGDEGRYAPGCHLPEPRLVGTPGQGPSQRDAGAIASLGFLLARLHALCRIALSQPR